MKQASNKPIWHKLAFKITASIGLLFVIMIMLIYTFFTHSVFNQFETFLEVKEEVYFDPQKNVEALSLSTLTDKIITKLSKQKDSAKIQTWINELSDFNDVLLIFIDTKHTVIASNQSEFQNAQTIWNDGQLTVTTQGSDQIEIIYDQVKIHALNELNISFFILPYQLQTNFLEIIQPEEKFKLAVTSNLMYLVLLFIIIGLFIIWWLIQNHTKRLSALTMATLSLKEGEYPPHIPTSGHDELTDLTSHFNQAFAGFKQQENLRKQMVSDVAHELRTPLTHIRGQVEAVLDGIIPCDTVSFQKINHEIIYLTRIVQDLQDLTLAQANELNTYPEHCLLHSEIEEIVSGYQYHQTTHDFIIENNLSTTTEVKTDKTRLKQIIINLLDNALKHSKQKTVIKFDQCMIENNLALIISDNGPGIPQDKIKYIFKRNTKLANQAEHVKSMGLGLAIVQELARLQDIEVKISSEVGSTSFTLIFPDHSKP